MLINLMLGWFVKKCLDVTCKSILALGRAAYRRLPYQFVRKSELKELHQKAVSLRLLSETFDSLSKSGEGSVAKASVIKGPKWLN